MLHTALAAAALWAATASAQSDTTLPALDPAIPINDDTVGRPFENVASSLPFALIVVSMTFAVAYYGNKIVHVYRAQQEVEKHWNLGKARSQNTSSSGVLNTNGIAATAPGDPSATNTVTSLRRSNVTTTPSTYNGGNGSTIPMGEFAPAPAGISNTRTSFKVAGSPATTMPFMPGGASAAATSTFSPQGAAPPKATQGLGDTLVEYDLPVFAMPGYMQMNFSDDVRLTGKIAEGGGGVIYKADLTNSDIAKKCGAVTVVVKVLKPLPHMAFSELKTTVYQEIAIMHALIHHPNIITLVGYTEEPLSIVTKIYDRNLFSLCMAMPDYASASDGLGALKNLMKADTKLSKGIIVKGFEMLPEIALHLAWGMASGMAEMHARGILHRDLKSANVLLELKPLAGGGGDKPSWMSDPRLENMAKQISGILGQNSLAGGVGWGVDHMGKPQCPVIPIICDFGLAKIIKEEGGSEMNANAVKGMHEAHATGISYRYAAPEAFNRMHHQGSGRSEEGKPVDVYAFAIMCWEMLERKMPFNKIANKDLEQKVRAGERPMISLIHRNPARPHEGNKHYNVLVRLIEACWKHDQFQRPTFDECKEKLRPFWLGPQEM